MNIVNVFCEWALYFRRFLLLIIATFAGYYITVYTVQCNNDLCRARTAEWLHEEVVWNSHKIPVLSRSLVPIPKESESPTHRELTEDEFRRLDVKLAEDLPDSLRTFPPEGAKPTDAKPESTAPDEAKPDDTTPEDTTPEDTTPEDTTPEDTTPEDTTPEDTTPEDSTPEDTTPEDTTPEDTPEISPPGDKSDSAQLAFIRERNEEYWKRILFDPDPDPDKNKDPTFDDFFRDWLNFPIITLKREGDLRDILMKDARFEEDERKRVFTHFSTFYGHIAGAILLQFSRWTNGWIQCFTFWAFWTAILMVLGNLMWDWLVELIPHSWNAGWFLNGVAPRRISNQAPWRRHDHSLIPRFGDSAQNEAIDHGNLTEDRIRGELNMLSENSREYVMFGQLTVVQMLQRIYETLLQTGNPADANAVLENVSDNKLKQLDSVRSPVLYLAWAIPSIGFIGTVLGIGSALVDAGEMMTRDEILQKEAIQNVTLQLGSAFDTTLIALVLSLLLMLAIYFERMIVESHVLKLQNRLMIDIIPFFTRRPAEQLVGSSSIPPTASR